MQLSRVKELLPASCSYRGAGPGSASHRGSVDSVAYGHDAGEVNR